MMNHRQRVLNAISRRATDCVAVAPYMYDVAAEQHGMELRQFYTDGSAMAQAQLTLFEKLRQDVIAIGCDNYYIAEGFGCHLKYELDDLPTLERPAVTTANEIAGLTVPNPQHDGRMPVMLEAIRSVRQMVGDDVAIRSPGTGPFALASYFLGSQQWLFEVALVEADMPEANESALRTALELATEALIAFGKACIDAGADILHCGDSLASCNVISPETYRRFAMPYQQRVFRAWKNHGAAACLLHICGDSTRVLDSYAETGADVIEIDHAVDLQVAKRMVGNRAALMGNLHTVTDLLRGDPQQVRRAASACIAKGGQGSGYVLGSGCIVPRHTPLCNLLEMVRVARSSRYPVLDR